MSSPTDTNDDQQDVWSAVAEGWDHHHEVLTEHARPITDGLIGLSEPRPGDVVLELAAGAGELSRVLAGHVTPGGRVICTDRSPQMVEIARRRATDVDHLSFQVLDAQQMDLADDSIDVIVCKMGLMLFPDPVAATAGCRRVLRPGGRLAVATWGPAEHNLWITTFGAAMLSHGHQPLGDPMRTGGIFSLSEPEAVRDLLVTAGFDDVTVHTLDLQRRFEDFDDYWRHISETSGPLAVILDALAPDEVGSIRSTCEEYAAHLRTEGGAYEFPARALVAAAR